MFKHHFPFFTNNPDLVYLDSAATTHKHIDVINAVNDYHQNANATVHRSAYTIANNATRRFEQARDSLAKLINCQNSAQVAFTSGATESINMIAAGLTPEMLQGQTILIMASEHHANILPWQQVAKRLGLDIEIVSLSTQGAFAEAEFEALKQQLSSNVAILAMAHVSNALGNIYPVAEICKIATQCNILTVIDGTQAIAHLPVDVEQMACDFYVFSGHKMYGPTGTGVLYGRLPRLTQLLPTKLGGEMIRSVSFTDAQYQLAPLKFEGGTPNIAGAIGLGAAAEFLIANLPAIQQHEAQLYEQLSSAMGELDEIHLLGNLAASESESNGSSVPILNQSIGLHSFVLAESTNSQTNLYDTAQAVYQQHVALRVGHHCAMPLMQYLGVQGTMRVSIGCYTSNTDIERFMSALRKALALGKPTDVQSGANIQQPSHLPIAEKIKAAVGWDNQYRQLLLASKLIPVLPIEHRVSENAVLGCESDLWIGFVSNKLSAYSQSKVIRGILALLLEKAEQQLAGDVSDSGFDYFDYLTELNLTPFFSVGRRDGIRNAINAINTAIASKH